MLKALLLFGIGFLNIAMGFLVYSRDRRELRNRLFFLFSLSLGGWVIGIGGFILSTDPSVAFVWAKAYYTFPLLIAALLPFFTYAFPVYEQNPKWLRRIAIYGLLLLALPLLIVPGFVTQELVYHSWGKEIVLNKLHYFLYSLYLLGLIGAGLAHIYLKSQKLTGSLRQQARAFFWGFSLTALLGVIFNLVFPWFGNYRYIWLGPLFTNAFILAIGYSIIKYKMFDIKSFAVRAAAYSFTTVIISVIYLAPILYAVEMLLPGPELNIELFIIVLAVMTVAGSLYGKVRTFFDKITNRLFFRDDYDAATLLSNVSRLLVSTIDLGKILPQVSGLLTATLKSDFCLFVLNNQSKSKQIRIGSSGKQLTADESRLLQSGITGIHQRIIVTDKLSDSQRALRKLLTKQDVAVLVRLDGNNTGENGLGYMTLGDKKNGKRYNGKDITVLNSIADVLVISIQNALHFEEIQNFNITLQKRVDEATAQLRRTNAKLEALDETKDDFISMASHQLRTPLTAVKGYLSMVLDGDAGKVTPAQRKMLSQAFLSSQRMVFLIADLLNVSRLKTGKFVIERTPVDLAELIYQEVRQLDDTAGGHSIELKYDKPKDFPRLMLDETKTRQVVMNFIDNAIHYTPAGGHIKVELTEKPHSFELRVRDDGIGVPKAEQHHLFTKFYRALNARRERPDGTGLGLFMAKKVIIAQGGAVVFESRENKGSVFGFTLPKDKVLAPAPAPVKASA